MRSWFKTQSLVTIKVKKERGKKRERKKGKIDHRTEKKGAKTMLQHFLAKLNGSMKLLRSQHPRIFFWKSLPNIGSKMWYRFDIFWKIVVFIVQSGLKLQYDFSNEDGEWKQTQNVVVGCRFRCRGQNVCQNKTTMNQTFNLFCITISLFEHLELLELRATSTVVLFCVVSL